jgi:peptidoglycan/LPS O-acetylase OafA/YrhL
MMSIQWLPKITHPLHFRASHNSIGLIRLILAIAVIYSHSHELAPNIGQEWIQSWSGGQYSWGSMAVDGFLAISGCLITASFFKARSLPVFLWHRLLRIFPGYWACVVVMGAGFPLLFGQSPDGHFVLHNLLAPAAALGRSLLGFVLPIALDWAPDLEKVAEKIPLTKGQGEIASLFGQNVYAHVMNGSLWTLHQELRLYLVVGCLGTIGLLRKKTIVPLLLLSWLGYALLLQKDPSILGAGLSLRTTTHFLMGSLFYFAMPPLHHGLAIGAMGAGILALKLGIYPLLSPLLMAYLMFWLASALPFTQIGRQRDYSYGLYIYAFPVQQALAAVHVDRWGLIPYFGLSVLITGGLAALSWHGIEKLALKWKHAFSPSPTVSQIQPSVKV